MFSDIRAFGPSQICFGLTAGKIAKTRRQRATRGCRFLQVRVSVLAPDLQ